MDRRAVTIGVALVLGLVANSAQAARIHGEAPAALSETDTYALETAAAACKDEDFNALMGAMAISDAVRLKYSAPEISVVKDGVTSSVASADYADFPIGMMDYYWVSRASMLAWDSNPDVELEYLDMEFNQSQANQWAVDWQHVRFDGNSEGGDDQGEIVERIGEPGVLSFEPFDGCWRLIEDYRGQG
ncbi:hypothetical protein [Devosia yakushimensis]|uniref:hypothetical protein n=1 Tax=Devosia yakushimensis TaxID=470028 RepID=UPI0024E07D8C|nr:hypothetical protein [Devosia yakushimensis]